MIWPLVFSSATWLDAANWNADVMVSVNNGRLTLDEIRHGVAGVLTVLKAWAISDQQILAMLGAKNLEELKRWVNGEAKSYPNDLPHRIGFIGSIHSRLKQVHTTQRATLTWLSTPTEAFENKRPIDVMAGGHLIGLMMVRDHLKGLEQAPLNRSSADQGSGEPGSIGLAQSREAPASPRRPGGRLQR
jgi:hypothetical protein